MKRKPKKLSIVLIIATIFSCLFFGNGLALTNSLALDNSSLDEYLLEVYCEEGIFPEEVNNILDDVIITNIVGFFEFDDQVITFGKPNEENLTYGDYLREIENYISFIQKDIRENELDFSDIDEETDYKYNIIDYPNKEEGIALERELADKTFDVDIHDNSISAKKKVALLSEVEEDMPVYKIKKLEFVNTKDKTDILSDRINNTLSLSKSDENSCSNMDIIVKNINLKERSDLLEEVKLEKEALEGENVNDGIDLNRYNQMFLDYSEDSFQEGGSRSIPDGGPQYPDLKGPIGPWGDIQGHPEKGDRQDRLKQGERRNDLADMTVYDWIPTYVKGETRYSAYQAGQGFIQKSVRVDFRWSQNGLDKLNIDDNEAVEIEVLFYNYGTDTGIPGNGKAWLSSEGNSWYSNLPSCYRDTRFMDSGDEKSYAVGTRYPGSIVANTQYYMNFTVGESPNGTSRLWQINFQRGYYYDHPNVGYRLIRGSGDEWFIFNEEYESTVKIKQYHKYDSARYAPEQAPANPFNSVFPNNVFEHTTVRNSYANQFRYREKIETFNTGNLPITSYTYPAQGHYSMRKFQVDSPGYYSIYTSKYECSSTDTTLTLFDHDFTQIAYNDDIGPTDIYSKIYRYFDKGDYYVICKNFNGYAFQCYINFKSGM